jgi:hypothetical protein
MEQWVPMPRTPSERPAETKSSRVPSIVAQPAAVIKREESNGTDSHPATHTNGTAHALMARDFDVSPVANYELSLDGFVPFSDITRDVASFLFSNLVVAPEMNIGSFEVEAKLGTIIDPGNGDRINLPISTEAVLSEGHHYRFQSHMTVVSDIDILKLDLH